MFVVFVVFVLCLTKLLTCGVIRSYNSFSCSFFVTGLFLVVLVRFCLWLSVSYSFVSVVFLCCSFVLVCRIV